MQINVAVGAGATTADLTVNAPTAQNVSVASISANAQNWLQVTALNPVTPNATFRVTVYPSLLTQGTYEGIVTFNVGSQPLQATVRLTVGTGSGGLTLSQYSVPWSYVVGGAQPSAVGITATVPITSTATSVYAIRDRNWVLIDGTTFAQKPIVAGGSAQFTLSFDASQVSAGITDTATVTFFGSDSSQQTVTVTLNTTGGSGLLTPNPTSLNFNYPSSLQAVLYVTNSTAAATTISVSGAPSWISISPSPQSVAAYGSAVFNVIASAFSTTGLSGFITITGAGTAISVPVTLGLGGGTGTIATPGSLSFVHQTGSSSGPLPQAIYLSGLTGGLYSITFTPAAGTPNNLVYIDFPNGTVPRTVQVQVNTGVLGTAASYSGTLNISGSGGSASVPVTVTTTTSAVVRSNPGAVVITSPSGTVTRYLDISSSMTGTEFPFTVTGSAAWIKPRTTSGTTPNSSVQVDIDPAGLASNIYSGNIVISAQGASNNPLNVPVVLVVGTGGGTGIATPASLSFTGVSGSSTGSPASQLVYVNVGAGVFHSIRANNQWISVSPFNNSGPSSYSVSISPASLGAGTHNGSITVISGTIEQTINVTATITGGAATVNVANSSLSFDYQQGELSPSAQTVNVTSTPSGAGITATVSSNSPWLTATLSGSTTPATLSVSVNPSGLGQGAHTGTVTVTPANGSAASINVTLTVRPAASLTTNLNLLSFTYRLGSNVPSPGQVEVGSTGAPLGFTATTTTSWIRISPASGTTPATLQISVEPGALVAGDYNGTVTITSNQTPASTRTVDVSLRVATPLPTIDQARNAASFVGDQFAPGEILEIAGTYLGPDTEITATPVDGAFPTELGGTRVFFNGVPGAVLRARADRVVAIVPFSVPGRNEVGVQVDYRDQSSNWFSRPLVPAVPGIFTQNSSGSGAGQITNADGSVNGPNSAAAQGSIITVLATGGGQTSPESLDGAVATSEDRTVLTFEATVGGVPAQVLYSGSAVGQVSGLMQLRIRLGTGTPSGAQPVVIRANNVSSRDDVTVFVR